MENFRRSWVEINLAQIKLNYQIYKQKTAKDIMAVVKADAYGHGAVKVASVLQDEGCSFFAVSNIKEAIELKEAGIKNPGPWTDHSRYVAQACQIIASHCDNLNEDDAYCYGLLHDIGRYVGVTKERHMLDGYTYCKERGWDKAAQIL